MSQKRKRKEQARLNEQTQFTVRWPALSPLDTDKIIDALTLVGNIFPASKKPTFLTFGSAAVARKLRHNTKDDKHNGSPWLILIARHTHQLFVRHLPFLAAEQASVQCCGLPMTSERLGKIFGLKSATVVGVCISKYISSTQETTTTTTTTTTTAAAVRSLLDSVEAKHVITSKSFVNVTAPALTLASKVTGSQHAEKHQNKKLKNK